MAIMNFGGVKEEVVMRKEFPMSKARSVLKNETIAVLGYGVQGPGQSLNMKDNGFNVIIGQSKQFKKDWDRAVADGWKPGKDLFDIEEAARRGTILEILIADGAHRAVWPMIKRNRPLDHAIREIRPAAGKQAGRLPCDVSALHRQRFGAKNPFEDIADLRSSQRYPLSNTQTSSTSAVVETNPGCSAVKVSSRAGWPISPAPGHPA